MTPRQRFHATMGHGQSDRVPLLDEGLRDDVLERWHKEGLPAGTDLAQIFSYDRRERIEINLEPRPRPTGKSAPVANSGQVTDPAWLIDALDADDAARWPADWAATVAAWRQREHIVELPIHRGLFLTLGVHGWADLQRALYLLADEPARARALMDVQARFAAEVADRVLSQVEVDLVSFSEPIADNRAPLIAPNTYRQVVLESYQPVLDALHRHGVDTVVYVTYGNTRALLPEVIEAGFNCLWAIETETSAMDYRELRRQFGPTLRLIGGIDLDCLARSDAAIEIEIQSKVPPLLAQGGYIPLADGRVRANIPFRSYAHYRRTLESAVRAF